MKLVRDVFLEDVEVIDASDLGGAFAEPAVLLIYARIYLDEVDTREVDLTALLVYGQSMSMAESLRSFSSLSA